MIISFSVLIAHLLSETGIAHFPFLLFGTHSRTRACSVTDRGFGEQWQTQWFLLRQGLILTSEWFGCGQWDGILCNTWWILAGLSEGCWIAEGESAWGFPLCRVIVRKLRNRVGEISWKIVAVSHLIKMKSWNWPINGWAWKVPLLSELSHKERGTVVIREI